MFTVYGESTTFKQEALRYNQGTIKNLRYLSEAHLDDFPHPGSFGKAVFVQVCGKAVFMLPDTVVGIRW